jgi:hypothetical protein
MPYYVTDEMEDCAGWAVITDTGEIVGCHLKTGRRRPNGRRID